MELEGEGLSNASNREVLQASGRRMRVFLGEGVRGMNEGLVEMWWFWILLVDPHIKLVADRGNGVDIGYGAGQMRWGLGS